MKLNVLPKRELLGNLAQERNKRASEPCSQRKQFNRAAMSVSAISQPVSASVTVLGLCVCLFVCPSVRLSVCPSVTLLAALASVFLDSSIFEKTSVQKLGYEKANMQIISWSSPRAVFVDQRNTGTA